MGKPISGEEPRMNDRERYFWDLTAGYLVVKGVLRPEELRRANEALDFCLQQHDFDPGMDSARQSRALAGSQAAGDPDRHGPADPGETALRSVP